MAPVMPRRPPNHELLKCALASHGSKGTRRGLSMFGFGKSRPTIGRQRAIGIGQILRSDAQSFA